MKVNKTHRHINVCTSTKNSFDPVKIKGQLNAEVEAIMHLSLKKE